MKAPPACGDPAPRRVNGMRLRRQQGGQCGVVSRGDAGFAMLAALLVALIAVLFAGVAVAAALGTMRVTASDGGHARARAAARAGLDLGLHRVAWTHVGPDAALDCTVDVPASGELGPGAADSPASDPRAPLRAEVTLESVDAVAFGWPSTARLVRVTSASRAGAASASVAALVALRPSAVPRGLSVAEDAEIAADMSLSGCGAYVGGVLRGREHVAWVAPAPGSGAVTPAPPSQTPPPEARPDHAWGGLWPVAGVHAGAGIWAAGVDTATLDPRPEAYAADTVGTDVAGLVELPGAAWLASSRVHALDPGAALAGGVLRLDRLPATLPTGEPGVAEAAGCADPVAGYVVFVSARAFSGGVVIAGARDPAWCPVTVVIAGDAVAAVDPGAGGAPPAPVPGGPTVVLRGALVVTGSLRVAADTSIAGHVACRRLAVLAPLSLSLGAAWRDHPPVGFLQPVQLARGEP